MKKAIVLDANILIRAVLGVKMMGLLESHHESVQFFTPSSCFEDAANYLPHLLEKRGIPGDCVMDVLESLKCLVIPIDDALLVADQARAKQRLVSRDEQDWAILATAMAFDCPIWTEDKDFFGCGVAVWNTQNIRYFLHHD